MHSSRTIAPPTPEICPTTVNADAWDSLAGIWTAFRDNAPVLYQLEGNPGAYPTIIEAQYRVVKELIVHDAFVFDTETIHTNFNEGLDDATNFTMAMAIIPLLSLPGFRFLRPEDGMEISGHRRRRRGD